MPTVSVPAWVGSPVLPQSQCLPEDEASLDAAHLPLLPDQSSLRWGGCVGLIPRARGTGVGGRWKAWVHCPWAGQVVRAQEGLFSLPSHRRSDSQDRELQTVQHLL